ncbi:hypothetical protein PG988_007475 [Apiospora saccharicola]
MSDSKFDLVLGASLSCAVFTAVKASQQTWAIYRRNKRFSIYVAIVWAEWVTSFALCVVSWMFLKGMHCILQTILNRATLLVINKHRARQLQVGTFVIVTLVNISVFCIWIPAQMHLSDRYVRLNQVWVLVEKSLFAVIDTSLNLYFLWALILIGSMSLHTLNYSKIHALAYLVKLHIELNPVNMMSRVVQTTNPLNTFNLTTAPTSE